MKITRRSAPLVTDWGESISPRLQQIYASRGLKQSGQLDKSLRALTHYQEMKGCCQAAVIIADAIQAQKKLIVVGDFDADGATSTALVMLALKDLGMQGHEYLVPNRFDFGYGLSPQIVEVAAQQGAELIVTVDSGIACLAGVDRANELGIDVVITDHHLPAETLPAAAAIVNPNQPGCAFPSKHLAGVGVAFYLMLALKAELIQRGVLASQQAPNLAAYLDIVALGTVADVVRLDDNNRILVYQGIQRIRSRRCRPGISALLDVAGRLAARLVASDLGFAIAPRLNAAGRLEDMSLGIECLLTDDDMQARHMASELDQLNQDRREIEQSMQQEALKTLESIELSDQQLPYGLALYQADWHQGVIGIVAGRIKERFFRPTIAFAAQDETYLKGSARSIPGLHIRDLLEELSQRYPDLIEKFGGHAMAAGLSIKTENFSAFDAAFQHVAEEWLQGRSLQGEILSDGELKKDEFSLNFAQLLKDAGPWGQGFEEPCFDGIFFLQSQRIVGQKHLKLQVKNEFGLMLDAIAFNVDLQAWPNLQAQRVQLAYKLDINEFRGNVSLQLMVEGLVAVD